MAVTRDKKVDHGGFVDQFDSIEDIWMKNPFGAYDLTLTGQPVGDHIEPAC